MTRRGRLPSPHDKPGLGDSLLAQIQKAARNRMVVFDAAPPTVREKTNEKGDAPLLRWWNGLSFERQKKILGED